MEKKIIKLLNKFENEGADAKIRYWNYYQNGFHLLEYGQTYSELLMISKKYGFIKWLIDNDKIDRERINDRWGDMSIHFTDEQLFIMSLSISDTPIEDLINYLK